MRDILFKAKRIDNGEWMMGFLFLQSADTGTMYCIGTEPIVANDFSEICGQGTYWSEVDQSTICQYTGLTDKNGKKIWENDIVKINNDFTGIIMWHDDSAAFCISANDDIHDFLLLSVYLEDYEVEIIGNIFDNSELLKGGVE